MNIVQGTTNANVTVPMILTEWHALAGSFVSGEVALRNFSNLLDAAYLVGWVPENITAVDWTQILMTRLVRTHTNEGPLAETLVK
jgi:hypothetical protein